MKGQNTDIVTFTLKSK